MEEEQLSSAVKLSISIQRTQRGSKPHAPPTKTECQTENTDPGTSLCNSNTNSNNNNAQKCKFQQSG